MTPRPVRPLAWVAFTVFVGSAVRTLFGGYSLDLTAPLIGAGIGATVGFFTTKQ